ncbi:MAG: hypothetical protein NTX32_00280 [Candidatus Firestonebacteria bacterium]|nr:hypothetical protein [Candidatus Firestonebacteria bacterium]
MNIEFTAAQYEKLIKMAFLGEWMINSFNLPDATNKDYGELLSHILSSAPKEGLEKYVHVDPLSGQCSYSMQLFTDPEVMEYIDTYKEECFWEELVIRMAERDFVRKYNRTQIKKMSREEYIDNLSDLEDTYDDEFADHGLQNLEIKK